MSAEVPAQVALDAVAYRFWADKNWGWLTGNASDRAREEAAAAVERHCDREGIAHPDERELRWWKYTSTRRQP